MQSTSSSSAESENIIGLGESPELSIAAEEIETLAIPTAQEECANCARKKVKEFCKDFEGDYSKVAGRS